MSSATVSSDSSATDLITVLVKSLSGDLISLDVDPSLGLKGVRDALADFDSEKFPSFQTVVFFIDESACTLTEGMVLGAILCEPRISFLDQCGLVTYQIKPDPSLTGHKFEHYFVWIEYPDTDTEFTFDFIYDITADSYAHTKTCDIHKKCRVIENTDKTVWFSSLTDLALSYGYITQSNHIDARFKYSRVLNEMYYYCKHADDD